MMSMVNFVDGHAVAGSPLTETERAEWARLTAWYMTWAPPTEPYRYVLGVLVSDPARCHAYYRDRLAAGVTGGCVESDLLAWMRWHFERYGRKLCPKPFV